MMRHYYYWVAVPLAAFVVGCVASEPETVPADPIPPQTIVRGTNVDGEEYSYQVRPGEPAERPADFMESVFTMMVRAQYDRRYATLHPDQQAAVTEAAYLACQELATSADNPLAGGTIDVLDVYDGRVTVLSGQDPQDAKRISYRVTVPGAGSFEDTGSAVAVDGEWRSLLPTDDIEAYDDGDCAEP